MRLTVLGLSLMATLPACALAQTGPWLDESDQRLEGSQLIQYQGFAECGHEDVQFLMFFGDMYARDPNGVLGALTGQSGEPISYEEPTEIPDGVVAQGFTSGDRELYLDPATREDYIYIYYQSGNLERWPRAEFACDQPGA